MKYLDYVLLSLILLNMFSLYDYNNILRIAYLHITIINMVNIVYV